MAFAKHDQFNSIHQITSQICRVFNHPARIKIISHLVKNGRTPYHDLARVIPLAHPTISQHLKVLREIDLILVEEKVPKTYYEINHVTCQQYLQFLKTLVFELEEDLNPSTPASPEF